MANTTEMLRLMRHAADLLDAQDPMDVLPENFRQYSDAGDCLRTASAVAVAAGTASAVLRMVAAAMDDEPDRVAVDPEEKPNA